MHTSSPSTSTSASDGRLNQDFFIIGEHLQKAHQSNAQAHLLHRNGMTEDALRQSQLTQVFLNNALMRVNHHCACLER